MSGRRIPRVGALVLGTMLALNIASLVVRGHWLRIGLAAGAALLGVVWLIALLHVLDFPWPWRHR